MTETKPYGGHIVGEAGHYHDKIIGTRKPEHEFLNDVTTSCVE